MTGVRQLSGPQRFLILAGLALAIFSVGALIGYLNGLSGNEGSNQRGITWAIRSGLLILGMVVAVTVLAVGLLSKLAWPPFIGWALLMGFGFALMNGGGVLLGMNDKDFLPQVVNGFLSGALIGAIAGPLIQRNQSRPMQKSQSGNTIREEREKNREG